MTLRLRILATLIPLFLLLAALGAGGIILLSWLGGRIDLIMRENYQSILAMNDLTEALEDMDGSFQLTLAGRDDRTAHQFAEARPNFWKALQTERDNVTLPGEQELVHSLDNLGRAIEEQGQRFHSAKAKDERDRLYFGTEAGPGLQSLSGQIREVARQIVQMNQDNMEEANRQAADAASKSLVGFAVGLFLIGGLAALVVWLTVQAIIQPIQAVTRSALAIGQGNLDQLMPVLSHDELGGLADAFNQMARQLRHYRQSHYQQLLRAQRTSQATIDALPHPVVVVDGDNQVSMANPAARRQLGVVAPAPDADAARPTVWVPPEPLRKPIADALGSQKPYLPEGFSETLTWRSGDQEMHFLPRVLPIQGPFGDTLGAAVLLEDVTRFRMADQVKSNLAATVSHELKTPLSGLQLALHILKEESLGPLSPKQMELVLDARDNADRLLALVNELLDLARLEEGRHPLRLRREKPIDVLTAAADLIRPRARDHQLSVVVDAPDDLPSIEVDSEQWPMAVQNLLSNAVLYTDPGGTITLRAAAEDRVVVLSITDTGQGIPPDYLPHIFDKFFRVPGQRDTQGTGLGLAIVREVVVAHGGTVSVESQVGRGTTFFVRLPASPEGPHGR